MPPSNPALRKQGEPSQSASGSSTRAVERTADGLVFRMFQPVGEANFAPDGEFAQALRKAANDAKTIEVRGCTDSPVADGPNRRLALARAAGSRRWLIDHGIDAARILASHYGTGHFLADNATEAGRSRNRRVEIQVHGDLGQAVATFNHKTGVSDEQQH